MFDIGKHAYKTDIKLGQKYRDPQTGITGIATAISFYQYACERASLEIVINGEIKEYTFDAPRLEDVETKERAQTQRTGGPGDPVRQRGAVSR